jgi:high-affinity nickel-transport protein
MTRMQKWFDCSVGRFGLYQCLRPLVIGLVHGLAGSAAVALLVLSTIHSPVWATVYLLIFGAGTMIGMMCMTAAIAVPLTFAGDRFAKLGQHLGIVSGVVSLCFGSFLVYQLGFLGGLFTSHPHWIPR